MIYQLSEYGRAVTWETWVSIGGCGLGNCTNAYDVLGPKSHWNTNVTLGDIENACPYSGRSLAYFAKENLNLDEFSRPYVSQLNSKSK